MKRCVRLLSILLLGGAVFFYFSPSKKNMRLVQAEYFYHLGEQTKDFRRRQEFFNRALLLYLELEDEVQPHTSGLFDLNFGNIYYQLGEYPLAVYQYTRARALRPRDGQVRRSLALARSQVRSGAERKRPVYEKVILLTSLSLPERMQMWFFLTLALCALLSITIWKGKGMRRTRIFFAVPWIYLSFGFLYQQFLVPDEGIVLRAAPLRVGAGAEYAVVKQEPIPSGTQLVALDSAGDNWLKVRQEDGTAGYLPAQSVRLLHLGL